MEFRVSAAVEVAKATLRDRLGELCSKSALSHYLVFQYPNSAGTTLEENIVATNWPAPLVRACAGIDLRSDNSFFGHFKSSISLIKVIGIGASPKTDSTIPFVCSVAWTLFCSGRRQYVFVMSSQSPQIDDATIGCAIFETMGYLARFTEKRAARCDISHRETQCLFWAAAGKSSEDIGAILGLSSHTVNAYFKSAMKKLHSINRTQAVAKATRLGVI